MSENLEVIEARAAAATPGPWVVHTSDGSWDIYEGVPATVLILSAHRHEQDAMFVAHARADIPALVAEVRRLKAALAAVTRERDEATEHLVNLSLVLDKHCGSVLAYHRVRDARDWLAAHNAAEREGA
jgi:hypothetical protein